VRSMLRVRDIPDQEQRQGTYKEHIRKMRRQ